MASIYCSIENCHYWGKGNVCKASEILVAADSWAAEAPDSIDAPQAQTVPTAQASDCMDTCCKTFVEAGSDEINTDNVTKNPY